MKQILLLISAILVGSVLFGATNLFAQPKKIAIPPILERFMKHGIPAPGERSGLDTSSSPDSVKAWIPLKAEEWAVKAPTLIGKDVEVFGDLSTQFFISRKSGLNNSGWMRDSMNKELLIVLFDKASDEQIAWMTKNKCRETCPGVFVRGRVVSSRKLRLKEVSFESRAGLEPAGVAVAEAAVKDTSSGNAKVLLPPGTVPPDSVYRWFTEIPSDSVADVQNQSMAARIAARADYIQNRDHNNARGRVPGPVRPADFSTTYRSIRDTRLLNVFAAYPWDVGQNSWPRVVLIVEDVSKGGGSSSLVYKTAGEKIADKCFRVSAKLWTGPAHSEDIPPFNWCLSEMRFNTSYNEVALWGMTPKTSMSNKAMGPKGTLGPDPPYLPAPEHHYDQWYFPDTIMLGNLLLDMGFSFGVPDGRVWIVNQIKH